MDGKGLLRHQRHRLYCRQRPSKRCGMRNLGEQTGHPCPEGFEPDVGPFESEHGRQLAGGIVSPRPATCPDVWFSVFGSLVCAFSAHSARRIGFSASLLIRLSSFVVFRFA